MCYVNTKREHLVPGYFEREKKKKKNERKWDIDCFLFLIYYVYPTQDFYNLEQDHKKLEVF